VTTDGYDPQEHAEQIDAVRAVAREALERESDWSALAQAGLLGLGIPEEHGGDGLGLLEVGVLLRGPASSRCGRRWSAVVWCWPPTAPTPSARSCYRAS
jgi:alkylation response protein AidB-like acyl-CoA dehydrogenase